MRVLHVIDSLDPKFGGPPMVASRLAAAQTRFADSVSLLTYEPLGDELERTNAALDGLPGANKIERLFAPRGSRVASVFGLDLARFIAPRLGEYDFVHFHSAWSPEVHAVARACRKAGTPFTVCCHGMLDDWCMTQKPLKKKLALRLGMDRAFHNAAFIHTLNDHEKNTVGAFGFRAPRENLANGIFTEEFDDLPTPGTFYDKHPELDGKPYILFMARLHYKKGLDILAEAFAVMAKANPEAHLVVAGPDDGAAEDFSQRINKHGLQSRAHLVGPIYGSEKYAALNDAVVFCLPSRQEGFSIAITEALAAGTPCVVTRDCHYPEVSEARAGLECSLDAKEIGEALVEVMGDDEKRTQMGQRGAAYVREHFTWPAIAERSMELYHQYADRGDNA